MHSRARQPNRPKQNRLDPAQYPSPAEFAAIIMKHDAGKLYPTVKKMYSELGPCHIRVNHDEEKSLIQVLPFVRSPVPSYIFKYSAGAQPQLVATHPPAPQLYSGEHTSMLKATLATNSSAIIAEDGVVVTVYWLGGDDEKKDILQIATNKSMCVNKYTRFRTGPAHTYEAALRRACSSSGVDVNSLDRTCCHTICFRDPSFNPCADTSRAWHVETVNIAQFNEDMALNMALNAAPVLKTGHAPDIPQQPTMNVTFAEAMKITKSNVPDHFGLLLSTKTGMLFVESARMNQIRQFFYGDFVDQLDRDADRVLYIAVRACLSIADKRDAFELIAPRIAGIVFPHVEAAITGMIVELCGEADVMEKSLKSMSAIVQDFNEPAIRDIITNHAGKEREKMLFAQLHNIKFTDVMYLHVAQTMEASGLKVGAF